VVRWAGQRKWQYRRRSIPFEWLHDSGPRRGEMMRNTGRRFRTGDSVQSQGAVLKG